MPAVNLDGLPSLLVANNTSNIVQVRGVACFGKLQYGEEWAAHLCDLPLDVELLAFVRKSTNPLFILIVHAAIIGARVLLPMFGSLI